jgi:D-glycerate 3-kinase
MTMIQPASTEPIARYVAKLHEQRCSQSRRPDRPLLVAISGPQGSGKSTVVKAVAERLGAKNLKVVEFSLDDVYLTHSDQVKLTGERENTLLVRRGLPGTHDIKLCLQVLQDMIHQRPTSIPQYDKSAFGGEGDRSSQSLPETPRYDIVLFEGWCVGFRQLPAEQAETIWHNSVGALSDHSLKHVMQVNELLGQYHEIWDLFDVLVHLDAEDLHYVYEWRLQQEHQLIASRGRGMSDEAVKAFVDGYMPAYELYNDGLRQTRTMGLTLDKERKVEDSTAKELPML